MKITSTATVVVFSPPGKKIKEEYCAKKCFLSLVSERDSKTMTGCLNFSEFEEFAVTFSTRCTQLLMVFMVRDHAVGKQVLECIA